MAFPSLLVFQSCYETNARPSKLRRAQVGTDATKPRWPQALAARREDATVSLLPLRSGTSAGSEDGVPAKRLRKQSEFEQVRSLVTGSTAGLLFSV